MTSNWFTVGDYINARVHLCLREGWRVGGRRAGVRAREISSHSCLILPRCDVPLILIFSSQMRAIPSITLHFNLCPLNISFLWYLQLSDSRVYKLQTFMFLRVRCDIAVNLPPQKINIAPPCIWILCFYSSLSPFYCQTSIRLMANTTGAVIFCIFKHIFFLFFSSRVPGDSVTFLLHTLRVGRVTFE